jgi:hypothetical protein
MSVSGSVPHRAGHCFPAFTAAVVVGAIRREQLGFLACVPDLLVFLAEDQVLLRGWLRLRR